MCHGFLAPSISPVAFSLDVFGVSLAIRWYAIAYIVSFLLGWMYARHIVSNTNIKKPAAFVPAGGVENLMTWIILGILLGGRLGYVFVYNPSYYLHNPLEILAIWHGGMSFHGGVVGVVMSLYLYSKMNKVSPLALGDLTVLAVPIGLFFGRLANFINHELIGRETHAAWAVCYAEEGGLAAGIARHPSQLYEAGLEGLCLGLVLYIFARLGALKKPGFVSGMFLFSYGAMRIFVENFREPDAQLGYLFTKWGMDFLTMGMLLSIPMVCAGLFLVGWSLGNNKG